MAGPADPDNVKDPDNLADEYIQTDPDNLSEHCFFTFFRKRETNSSHFILQYKVLSIFPIFSHVLDMAERADLDNVEDLDNLADGYIQTDPDNLSEHCFFAFFSQEKNKFIAFLDYKD